MKLTNVLAILMAAVVMMIWITGCCSTAPKPVATIKGDLQFTEEVTSTVTADQAIVMDGKKFKVADVPAQLVEKNTSKYITIVVYPESKMSRETLVDLIKTLVKNKYIVTIGAGSKYADVPIPRS
ncbi:hypothetical protein ACFLQL_02220 [Verrucomicrobiota bacterium]